jgi:hypothetical protein
LSYRKWRQASRRALTVVSAATAILITSATAALAFTSPGNPPGTGPQNIVWTGQGSTNGQIDSSQCDAANDPLGANQPYLLWILATDGGSVQTDNTTPVLHLTVGGNPVGNFTQSPPFSANSVHIVTPYFKPDLSGPNALGANADMNVLTTGNGSWNLVISHGCAGPPAASPPTVTKDAAGAFRTTFVWDIHKSVDKTQINAPPGQPATFTYTVVVTHDSGTNSHVVVSGHIDVKNPDSAAINTSNVVDGLSDGVNCTFGGLGTLSPGDNTVPYTCNLPDNASLNGLTNTVTVNWNDQTLGNGSHLSAGTASFTTPPIQFSQSLVNNCVTPNDPQAPAGTFPAGGVCSTDPSPQTFTYSVTYNAPSPGGTCETHTNTAVLPETGQSSSTDVKVCSGADLVVTKDATPKFTRVFTWQMVKSLAPGQSDTIDSSGGPVTANYLVTLTHDAGTDSGWTVTGTIHVANPNNWEDISITDLADAIDNGGSCTVDGSPGFDIPANGSQDYAYTCTYASAPSPADFTNTATVKWDAAAAATTDGSATGQATGKFGDPTTVKGDQVTVSDSLAGPLGTFGLDPNPHVIPYSITFAGDPPGTCTVHPNTATFTDNNAATGVSQASVKVCVGADLVVAKTANPSFDRKYNWLISKSADKTRIIGGHVTYTVIAKQDPANPFTDGNFKVGGTITVSNVNDFEAIQLTSLTDSLGNCTLTPALPAGGVSIPASSQATFAYTCGPFASSPGKGQNVATAAWTGGFTPDQSSTGSASFDFGGVQPTNLVNQFIHVTDSYAGPLGTAGPATDAPPFASATFTYTRSFPEGGNPCTIINNTATITETGQNASAQVLNCSLGGLTMGFWHNTNGQNIIKGSSAVGNWLRQFAPFQDLPVNATGAQVAAYDLAVFNAATCGGSTCNAMLKAQMLATALDVYFSDPALGGNKIGAPAPIGPAVIDLTNVGGTNVSAAFGGASSMTVLQALAYAASKSNVGGSVWYGQVKATQVLAETLFDAINNNTVTGP